MISEDDADLLRPSDHRAERVLSLSEASIAAALAMLVSPPAPDPVPEHDSPLAPPALPKCCGWCDLK
jgi:hypothetical protein